MFSASFQKIQRVVVGNTFINKNGNALCFATRCPFPIPFDKWMLNFIQIFTPSSTQTYILGEVHPADKSKKRLSQVHLNQSSHLKFLATVVHPSMDTLPKWGHCLDFVCWFFGFFGFFSWRVCKREQRIYICGICDSQRNT